MAERAASAPGSGYDLTVLAVFADSSAADAAVREVTRTGLPSSRVQVDQGGDDVVSLRAEMREEIEHTVVGPGPVGPATKEMSKGLAVSLPLGVVLGALLVLPFGFIPFAGLALVIRLILAAVVGAAAGTTVALVLGGGLGAKGPGEPMAAERGLTVRVRARSPEEGRRIADIMGRHRPIRVDLLTAFDQPERAVSTEEDRA